jgi:glycosyltransferase involved in cell wall biosynthesis
MGEISLNKLECFNNYNLSFFRNRINVELKDIIQKNISVLISAYNTSKYIEECLDSVYNQCYNGEYEVILGIDGCEETLKKVNEIKHKYSNLKCYYSKKNVGKYIISNSLIFKSKYDIITIFDSDDIMLNNHLEYNHSLLKTRENSFVISRGRDVQIGNSTTGSEYNMEGVIFIDKNIILSLNGFREYRCACDTDLMTRLYRKGVFSIRSNVSTFNRRIHKDSLTNIGEYSYGSSYRTRVWGIMSSSRDIKIDNMITTDIELID